MKTSVTGTRMQNIVEDAQKKESKQMLVGAIGKGLKN